MKIKIILIYIASFVFSFSSCKKEDTPLLTEINHEIYVGGWSNPPDNTTNGAFYGQVWTNNGANQQLSTTNESRVLDIFKNTNDLYCVGYYTDSFNKAAYWKNGVVNILPNDINGNQVECAKSVFVKNSDVYIVGGPFYSGNTGTLWINGITVPLPYCSNANDVIVSNGNNVYVAGTTQGIYDNVAAYWINDSIIPIGDLSSTMITEAKSITVSNNDIYVAGREYLYSGNNGIYYSKAILWKNNQKVFLPNLPNYSEAISVTTSDSDVYVLVREENSSGYTIGSVYKNAIRMYTLNDGLPTSMAVKDGVVYVSGYDEENNPKAAAVYWKNGNKINLTDGIQSRNIASSIFVR